MSRNGGGFNIIKPEQARTFAQDLQLGLSKVRPVLFHGPTMLPLLADGDRLEIVQVRINEIRVGDIVTYRDQNKYPTRRVIGFNPARNEFLIQADHKPARIFRVPSDAILGRVEARIRNSSRLARTSLRWRWVAWSAPYRWRIRKFLHRRKRRI